jgi:arsenate reductase
MKLNFYIYKNCGTCRKAKKFLTAKEIEFEEIPIREKPPSIKDLHVMLDIYKGDIRRLFNTSGVDYRAMNLKDKLPDLKDSEALKLLSNNGNLIKRPFAIRGKEGAVGFSEAVWGDLFL